MRKLMPLLALLLLLAGCGWNGTAAASPDPGPVSTPRQPVLVHPASTVTPSPEAEPSPLPVEPSAPVRPAPPVTAAPTAAPEPEESPLPEPVPDPTPEPLPEPVRPEDEDVLAAYRQAVEAFRWFQAASLPHDPDSAREVGEVTYYRVTDPGITTLPDLRGYLKRLFSDGLVDSLLPAEGGRYIELDGELYVQPVLRGDDPSKGAETRQVSWESEDRCAVQVVVELLDPDQGFAVVGSERYDFSYEKVGDKWIFTSFFLIR